MPKKLHFVNLKKSEKTRLQKYVAKGQKSARSINRARILLLSNEEKTDEEIVEALGTSLPTIYRARRRYNEEGLDSILQEKSRSGAPEKIDARVEAQLAMIACTDPPEGHAKWTLRLLANKLIELELVDSISHTQVGTLLKKTNLNPG